MRRLAGMRPYVVTEWLHDGSLFRIWSVPGARVLHGFSLPRLVWCVSPVSRRT